MTDLDVATRPSAPASPAPSRSIAYLVAAAVLVVGVVAAVLVFGVQRPPALEGVAAGEAPAPPAGLAWTEWRQQDCIWVVQPDGSANRVTCDRDGLDLRGWTDDGLVVTRWSPSEMITVEVLDPADGGLLDTWEVSLPSIPDDLVWPDVEEGGTDLHSRWHDGTLTVTARPSGDVLWTVDTYEGYRVDRGVASPDGSVIAAVDSTGRLLVMDPAGDLEPRVWRSGAPTWGLLVWEGTELPDGFPTGG